MRTYLPPFVQRLVRPGGLPARFLGDRSAVSAVEFAFVAAPFIAIVVAILQTAIVFFAGQVLETITEQSGRLLMTGQAQTANMTQTQFASAVCGSVHALFNCNNLMIDVETASAFSSANMSMPKLTFNPNGTVSNTWQYNPGTQGSIVVLRIMYQWPIQLGPLGFNLANLSNGNRLLMAAAVFKSEQYQ